MRVRAVVLAGGAARRMGGGHKPLLRLGGRPLVERVLERLSAQRGGAPAEVLINAPEGAYERLGLPVAPDGVPGRPGPLAGVLAGLEWRPSAPGPSTAPDGKGASADPAAAASPPDAPPFDALLSVPGDAPWLPLDLLERLRGAMESQGADVARAASESRGGGARQAHPVAALWRPGLAAPLRRALVEEGVRRVDRFTGALRVAEASWPVEAVGGAGDPFRNLNTPEDLALAEADLASGGAPA